MAVRMDDGDHDLIAAAQRGEAGALDALVRRHDRWVRNVVYATVSNPAVVDDVVQMVWAKVWQQIGTLIDPKRWRSWLYKLAKHAAIDAGQKAANQRRIAGPEELLATVPDRRADPMADMVDREEQQIILAAIHGLPDLYREPFILRHLEEWSYAEIGEAMGLPVDTVETRLVRARRLLRDALRQSNAQRENEQTNGRSLRQFGPHRRAGGTAH